jgi:DNA-directed RNA polymerase specialized sigma24 family protein
MDLRLSLEEQKTLAKDACKGDKQAQDKIYLAYREAIFGYIRARSIQDADAEDISQDFWQQIFTRKEICRYDPSRRVLYVFFRIIAHSRLIDYYRKRGRDHWVPIIEDEVSDDEEVRGEGAGKTEDHIDFSSLADFQINSDDKLNSAYKIALEYLFRNGGYPHQVIVFAFIKLVDHWKPQKIIDKLSDLPLRQLCKRLYQEYLTESNLPEEEIVFCFSYLEQGMDRLVGEVITDSASREKLKAYLDKSIGDTLLKDYFGKDASHSISDWCDKVRKRLGKGSRGND